MTGGLSIKPEVMVGVYGNSIQGGSLLGSSQSSDKVDKRCSFLYLVSRCWSGSELILSDTANAQQKLEQEITPKEAQSILGCCKSYISQLMVYFPLPQSIDCKLLRQKPCNLAKLKKKADLGKAAFLKSFKLIACSGLDPKLTKAHLPKFPQERAIQMAVMKGVQGGEQAACKSCSLRRFTQQTAQLSRWPLSLNQVMLTWSSLGRGYGRLEIFISRYRCRLSIRPKAPRRALPSRSCPDPPWLPAPHVGAQVGSETSGGEEGAQASELSHPDVHGDTDSGLVV
eukprot:765715-Hanusia_phi.AAC.2